MGLMLRIPEFQQQQAALTHFEGEYFSRHVPARCLFHTQIKAVTILVPRDLNLDSQRLEAAYDGPDCIL